MDASTLFCEASLLPVPSFHQAVGSGFLWAGSLEIWEWNWVGAGVGMAGRPGKRQAGTPGWVNIMARCL